MRKKISLNDFIKRNKIFLLIISVCISNFVSAQKDTTSKIEVNKYYVIDADGKTYCNLKVLGSTPFKVISAGYDFQSSNILSSNIATAQTPINPSFGSPQKNTINFNQGFRFAVNLPIISKAKWMVLVGFSYLDNKYSFTSPDGLSPFPKTLNDNGLRSMDGNFTIFKPLNEKFFLLNQNNFTLSGDYSLSKLQPLSTIKFSTAVLFGWKPHSRLQTAIGLSRTYRGGEQSIVPVLLYNCTFQNSKWGIESLLPSRAAVRFNANAKNIISGGFLLEGNSYYLGNLMNSNPLPAYSKLELRRSELRVRLTYECSIHKSIWLSLQAGYRINSKFNIDEGDFYRGYSNLPYVMENKLTNPFYGTVTINFVAL